MVAKLKLNGYLTHHVQLHPFTFAATFNAIHHVQLHPFTFAATFNATHHVQLHPFDGAIEPAVLLSNTSCTIAPLYIAIGSDLLLSIGIGTNLGMGIVLGTYGFTTWLYFYQQVWLQVRKLVQL